MINTKGARGALKINKGPSIRAGELSPTPGTGLGHGGCLMHAGFIAWDPFVQWHGGLWLVSEKSVGTLSESEHFHLHIIYI